VARPLADAGAAGVGQHDAADALEVFEHAVAFDGVAHLLRAGGDRELRLRLDPFFPGLRAMDAARLMSS
jgi:hypothetical protein